MTTAKPTAAATPKKAAPPKHYKEVRIAPPSSPRKSGFFLPQHKIGRFTVS